MSETSSPAGDWTRDEALSSLLDIFDRADKYARMHQAESTRSLAEATRRLEEATRELEMARHEVARLKAELDRLQNSLSWRVTKPLRSVRFAVGSLLHPSSGV
ncbi:MAG TPA: hypothetical protein VJY15_12610 [Candidatus Acidoferrum sp.]|nr:hypothetical protein [Candidatus Acidoferrum sp.]